MFGKYKLLTGKHNSRQPPSGNYKYVGLWNMWDFFGYGLIYPTYCHKLWECVNTRVKHGNKSADVSSEPQILYIGSIPDGTYFAVVCLYEILKWYKSKWQGFQLVKQNSSNSSKGILPSPLLVRLYCRNPTRKCVCMCMHACMWDTLKKHVIESLWQEWLWKLL